VKVDPSHQLPLRRPRPAPGHLTLESTPWSEIYRGQEKLGTTPLRFSLPAGRHRLRLYNPEQKLERTITVRIGPGAEVKRLVKLTPGRVAVFVKPWGRVSVDGEQRGITPMAPLLLSPGRHTIQVVNPETGKRDRRTFELGPGERFELKFDLTR